MNQAVTRRLWADFSDGLWRFIRARVDSDSDADDVLQDVFLKVHTRRTQLRDDERVAGWIFRIASNAVADHHRERASRAEPPRLVEPAPVQPPRVHVDEAKLLARCVRPFVEQLAPHYRDALLMTEFDGMTQAEAAEVAGISLSGMKSRVQRGRARLREAIDECCEVTLDVRNRVTDVRARCEPSTCRVSPEIDF